MSWQVLIALSNVVCGYMVVTQLDFANLFGEICSPTDVERSGLTRLIPPCRQGGKCMTVGTEIPALKSNAIHCLQKKELLAVMILKSPFPASSSNLPLYHRACELVW